MSGRLDDDLLERFLKYGVRVLDLVDALEKDNRPRRIVDQLTGSGTSPGAQMFEADEAVSRADFIKSLGWASKELSETKYWLKIIVRKKWMTNEKIAALLDETDQLSRILKAMKIRSKRNGSG